MRTAFIPSRFGVMHPVSACFSSWVGMLNGSRSPRPRARGRSRTAERLELRNLLSRTVSVASGLASLSDSGDGLTEDLRLFVVNGSTRLSDTNNVLVAGSGTSQIDANTIEFTSAITGFNLSTGTGQDVLTVDFTDGNPVPSGGMMFDGGADANDGLTLIGSVNADAFDLSASGANLVVTPGTSNVAAFSANAIEVLNLALGAGDDSVSLNNLGSAVGITEVSVLGEDDQDTFVVQPCELATVTLEGGAPNAIGGGEDRVIIDLLGVTQPRLALTATGGGVLSADNRSPKTAEGIEQFDVINGTYDFTIDLSSLPSANDGTADALSLAVDPTLTAYRFTEVARGDGAGALEFTGFVEQPAINSSGEVAFLGALDANGGTRGVFKGNSQSLTTIATQGQTLDASHVFADHGAFATNVSINSSGTVLFDGKLTGNGTDRSGVFGGNGGAITVFGPPASDPVSGPNFFAGSVINDAGNALMLGGVSSAEDLYLGNGITASVFVDSSAISSPSNIGAFFGVDVAGPENRFAAVLGPNPGVFRYIVRSEEAGGFTTIVDVFDPSYGLSSFGLSTSPSMNSAGTVAFIAQQENGGPIAIYTGSGGALTNLVDSSGPYNSFNANFGVALNEAGNVAFLATLDTGNVTGIFTGPDPVRDKVIQVGDALFDSTVTGLEFNRFGLNDNGQLAFLATLANGDQVIARAEPAPDRLIVSLNTTPIFTDSLQSITTMQVIGSNDDDRLSLDLSIEPVSVLTNLIFDAGEQGANGDAISLSGGTHELVVHTLVNAHDGSIQIDGVLTVDYTGLEPISDLLAAADRTFVFAETNDVITLSDDDTPNNGRLRLASVSSSETVDFVAPSNALTIQTGAGHDSVTIASLDAQFSSELFLDGELDNDELTINVPLTGATTILGNDGTDTILLGPNGSVNGTIDGGQGTDTLSYATRLTAVSVNLGAGSATSLTGTLLGIENVTGGSGADSLIGGSDANRLLGGDGADIINGGGGADTVDGQAGDDNLNGGSGNDLLTGGAGNDTLVGATGTDTLREVAYLDFQSSFTRSIILSTAALVVRQSTTTLSSDSLSTIELADVSGGAMSDLFDATGFVSAGVTSLSGGGRNDTILGSPGADLIITGTGLDSILGNGGADTIFSGSGNDTLQGGDGDDNLSGQNGNDSLSGDLGNDVLVGGAGIDTLLGGVGNDFLTGQTDAGLLNGGDGNDNLQGNAAADTLNGDAGDDRLYGLQGNDVLSGGDGNDQLQGGSGSDTLNGGAGLDSLTGEGGNDVLDGGADSDRINELMDANVTITGASLSSSIFGNDTATNIERINLAGGGADNLFDGRAATVTLLLTGAGGNDTLLGGSKGDIINGNDGDDVISGGAGTDTVDGGNGTDHFFEKADANFTINGVTVSSTVTGTETPANIEVLVLIGGAGANSLNASAASVPVILLGGGGADTLLGGAQTDSLIGGSFSDKVGGTDSLNGGSSADVFHNDPQDTLVDVAGETLLDDLFSVLPVWVDRL